MKKIIAIILCLISCSSFGKPNLNDLAGIITNQYNVRDDIFNYIMSIFPPLSESAFHAVIKIASNQNFLYYKVKTHKEASETLNQNSIAKRCLSLERQEDDYKIFKTVENMMVDSRERYIHVMKKNEIFFAVNGMNHPRITKEELMQKCASKDY